MVLMSLWVVVWLEVGSGEVGCSPTLLANRVLAVVDWEESARFTGLLKSLEALGLEVDAPRDLDEALLKVNGEWAYGAVFLLAPRLANFGGDRTQHKLRQFLDEGGSILVAADREHRKPTEQMAASMGIVLDKSGRSVVDFEKTCSELDTDGSSTWIYAGGFVDSPRVVGESTNGPIVFHGIGSAIDPENELVEPVLWGSPSAFADPNSQGTTPLATGTNVVLAAVLQTREGGRAAYIGSIDILSDKIFSDENFEETRKFVKAITSWTLGYRGILRVDATHHYRKSDGISSDTYRIKDVLDFSTQISEWDGAKGSWIPYEADDVQLEFTMLDPFQRSRLLDMGNGTFRADVLVPERIGMYKFVIDYVRVGVSHIHFQEVVGIRPFNHNEYERFIIQAFPYYTALFSMLAGVILLGYPLLYGKPKSQ